jgi:hypothetical protein
MERNKISLVWFSILIIGFFINVLTSCSQNSFKSLYGSWFGINDLGNPLDFSVNANSDSIIGFLIYMSSTDSTKWFSFENVPIKNNSFELIDGTLIVNGVFNANHDAKGIWKWAGIGEGTWNAFKGNRFYIPQFTSDNQIFPKGSVINKYLYPGDSTIYMKELIDGESAGFNSKTFINLNLASFGTTRVLEEIFLIKDGEEENILASNNLVVSSNSYSPFATLFDSGYTEIKGPCKFGLRLSHISGAGFAISHPSSCIAFSVTPPSNDK